jgi:glycosyltransferase involved in cell wall biosynthesis
MKVVHIAAGNSGGAFRGARNLCDIQKEFGIDTEFLTSYDRSRNKKILSKLVTAENWMLTRPEYGIMSLHSLNSLGLTEILNLKPDVVHIHNWFNLLSIRKIIELSNFLPIVITMHDERLLTGGCHNHLDCQDFKSKCHTCPAVRLPVFEKVRKAKTESEILLKTGNIEFVTPSDWLRQEVLDATCGVVDPTVIPNPLHKVFYSYGGVQYPQGNSETLKLLFIAANPWVPLKGLKNLLQTLSDLENEGANKFILQIVGSSPSNVNLPRFVKLIGQLDEIELVKIIQNTDIVVVPSLSENLPTVILEAQYLGKMVVATNVGGIPELISDSKNGLLQHPNETLKDLLRRTLKIPAEIRVSLGMEAKSSVSKKISRESLAIASLGVYRKAINNAK